MAVDEGKSQCFQKSTYDFQQSCFFFPAGGRFSCGSTHHYLRQGESDRFLQTLHDPGNLHPVPQTQRHKPGRLLLPEPALP